MAVENTLVGQTIGKYQIRRWLAIGGMATIYLAWHPDLQKEIVLKILRPGYAQDERFVRRFQREASEAANLNHPHIIRIYDAGESGGHYYIAMEYIRGGSLHDRIMAQRGRPLELSRALDIVRQVGSALEYAHAHGIVHRDIKPSNILIDEQGGAMLTDLGIAKALAGTRLTQTMTTIGTPEYMSPEQGKGTKVDVRTDIYSLGVVLYEMLTGRLPFRADTPWAVIHQHIYEPPPPLHRINPTIPQNVVLVVNRAMSKDPAARFQSAAEMMRALTVQGVTPAPTRMPRPTGRVVLWSTLAAIVVVILLIAVMIAMGKIGSGPKWPTATAIAIVPKTEAATDTPTVAPTSTSKVAVRVTSTSTARPSPTHTLAPSPIATASPPDTPTLALTPGLLGIFHTPTPSATPSPTNTPSPTSTSSATVTPTPPGPLVRVSSSSEVNLRDEPSLSGRRIGTAGPSDQFYALGRLSDNTWIRIIDEADAQFWIFADLVTVEGRIQDLPVLATPMPTQTSMPPLLVATPSPEATEILPLIGPRVPTERLFHISYPMPTYSNIVQPSLTVTVLDLNGQGLAGWRVEVEGFHDLVTDPQGRVRFGDITSSGFHNVRLKGPKGEDLPEQNGTKAAGVELNYHYQTYVIFQEVVTLATPTPAMPTATPEGGIWQREMVAVAIHPADPNIVVVVAKDGKAFRSISGGRPWEPINELRSVSGMIADQNNPGTFYAGTWNGVLKSTDGGASWVAKNAGLSGVNRLIQVVAIDPVNSNVLLAGLNKGGVYKSMDGAENWFASNQGMVSADIVAITYHPANTAIVYAGAASTTAPFRSLDGGSAWSQMEYYAVWGTFGVGTHGATPGSVFLGVFSDRASIVRNNEAGQGDAAHWFDLGKGLPFQLKYGPLVIAPSDANRMYVGTGWYTYGNSNGIYYSHNGGQSWAAGRGLLAGPDGKAPYVQDIAVHPHDANIVYAATGTGLYKSADSAQTWQMQ